jgi:hypothetical protein
MNLKYMTKTTQRDGIEIKVCPRFIPCDTLCSVLFTVVVGTIVLLWKNTVQYTDKKEIKFSSYIRKFRMEQLQSHI